MQSNLQNISMIRYAFNEATSRPFLLLKTESRLDVPDQFFFLQIFK